MIIWLDAQLAPALAPWIQQTFKVEARSVRDVGLRDAKDVEIFDAALAAGAIVMTKDSDFVKLHFQKGFPPQIIWLTCGNTSNQNLRIILTNAIPKVLVLLQDGEGLVEISGK